MNEASTFEDLVTLSVRVPSDLRRRLRLHALERGLSAQDCVRQAVTDWLDAHATGGTAA